ALFHDIGKPATKRMDHKKNDWSFHGHEVVGAKITKKTLERLCFSKEFVSRVTTLVRWHMFFSDPEQITLSAVRRLVSHIGKENIEEIVNLRICDRIGTGRPKERPYRLRKYQSMIEEAMRDPVSVKSLALDGNTLMSELGMQPGPKIGYILHALLEEVLDDPSRNTKEHLTERAKGLLELTEEDLKKLGEKGKEKLEEEDEKVLEEIRKKYWVK
ncbi:MAG: HD domain-containing protein, partial [Candidatus Paceibacterota bacterium]